MIALPTIECQGKCHTTCGVVPMSRDEVVALQEASGQTYGIALEFPPGRFLLTPQPGGRCPALTADNRCAGYAGRPLLCRLYGLVDDGLMRCEWGCKPSRYLSKFEGFQIISGFETVDACGVQP